MKKRFLRLLSVMLVPALVLPAVSSLAMAAEEEAKTYTVEYFEEDDFYRITNPNGGPTLSYRTAPILEVEDGGYTYAFKDLDKDGELDDYEDWRLSYEDRANDIADKLPLESIAGLMLFSAHTGPDMTDPENPGKVSDEQYNYLINDGIRAILYARSQNYDIAVKWANGLQAVAEENDPFGIPVNISSDPRNSVQGAVEDDLQNLTFGSGWPTNLGLAATFNPEYAFQMGQVISDEYRAIGIGTALSPQIDLATEPRWRRFSGTYGEDVDLASDIARAIVSGMQSSWDGIGSDAEDLGWGNSSIIAMVKHFPGDGPGEAGREAHNNYGKYAAYPGDNMSASVKVFEATMNLGTKTERAMAVMPSYSIAIDKYGNSIGQMVGSGYSSYKLNELLRGELGFTGVICSDWGITGTKNWGVEHSTTVEKHLMAVMNGLDMLGGNNAAQPFIDAYEVGSIIYTDGETAGSDVMDEKYHTVAYHVLYNEFLLGLFEDPYLSTSEALETFTNEEYASLGYEAQQNSVILLKNKGGLLGEDTGEKKTVYVPMELAPKKNDQTAQADETLKAHLVGDWSQVGFENLTFDGALEYSFDLNLLARYFNVVTDELRPEADLNALTEEDIVRRTDFADVDFALVSVAAPQTGGGYDAAKVNLDPAAGPIDNGYYPISLIYGDYTADPAVVRPVPLGLDPDEEVAWVNAGGERGGSRYYGGKTTEGTQKGELALILNTKETIGDLPLVVYVSASRPFCLYEFEEAADAIVLGLGVSSNAVLDNISGQHEFNGLLPMQLPADMETVELQFEDVGRDMTCYVDSEGNTYDFAYGLNWSGVIADERVANYY